ncbi:MAG: Omp28-related outer membrane protein [Flavobacteriales bacterium]|nr:Omp28-related outer membrane protein [Flavobacteriales bacterium]MBP7156941.1 Omp28-related outer membrane protein [Flavobacteriales bacterium]HQV76135.1 Omp28-related outer membrane protein [Flavobacteriales bacterium]HQW42341.1 Omp28-related outer membrane protein [Flavobacteriales bacterium]
MRNNTLSKALLGLFLTGSAISLHAQNAYLQNASLPRYIKAGVNYPISVWARNNSTIPLPSFSIRWKLDAGTWNTGPTITITAPGISSSSYVPNTHPVQLNTTQGAHTLVIEIMSTTDSDLTNNTITINFTALSTWADKVVLLEARTETWCPQCPPSNTLTNTLMSNPDFAVGKFHLSDALDDCPECITYFNQHNAAYTPAGIIEMGEYGGYEITSNYNGWEAGMTARAAGVAPVELALTSSVNSTTRVITFTLSAEFTYAVTGTYALNVYVAEDGVPGPQSSAPANYIHNKVMRAMLGGVTGTMGVVPNTPVVGTTYQQTYSYTVPANFNITNLHFIGVLEHNLGGFNNRYAINAVRGAASGVGIAELGLGNESLEAYPNPFTNELYVSVENVTGPARVELFGLDGRSVFQHNIVLGSVASTRLDLGGAGLSNGAYVLRIATDKGTAEQRVIKVD